MWDFRHQFQRRLQCTSKMVALLLCLPLLARAETTGNNLSQNQAQAVAAQINTQGSDQSMQNSTVLAMRALMDLAATRVPSAINNGLNAYGKFRNSEHMDKMTDVSVSQANSLSSIDGPATITGKSGPTVTSFRRLDPAFLRQGEAGKVAEEFERQTGMRREEFLTQLSTVSEQKIRRSDPMLIDKALSRFEGFVSKIPNAEFRKKLEKNIALVPDSMRKGLIAQAVTKFANFVADTGANPVPATNQNSSPAPALAAAPNVAPTLAAATNGSSEAQRATASSGPSNPAGISPISDTEKDGKNAIGSVVQMALESTQKTDLSIFQIVTRRYRILTPSISPSAN